MTIAQLIAKFAKLFGPVEREAETVAHHIVADVHSAVHLTEKEIAMIKFDLQVIAGALDRIKGMLGSETALQQQINDLTTAGEAKDKQISDLTTAGQEKDQAIADLTTENGTLTQGLADVQAQLLAVSPDPNAQPAADQPPADDGSGSADVTP